MSTTPRGTKDLFATEISKIKEIESLLISFANSLGYEEIQTPTFEKTETFKHNSEGEANANKEFFFVSGEKYVLKPENTAPVVRSVINNNFLSANNAPLSFFYSSKCFRHERPQLGRSREFLQFGMEKINAKNIHFDIELLISTFSFFRSLGLDLTLKINFLSSSETKKKWNDDLRKYFRNFSHLLTSKSQERVEINPLRILDDKVDSKLKVVQDAPKIFEYLSEEERKNIESLKEALIANKIPFLWDESLVRGIDYYTGCVYEWQNKDGLAIGGGGRYDELFQKFNYGMHVPCLGLALGMERLITELEKNDYLWKKEKTTSIYLAYFSERTNTKVLDLITKLRNSKIIIYTNWDIKQLKRHFKAAEKYKSEYILLFGNNESEKEEIILKKQNSTIQHTLSLKELTKTENDILKILNDDK